MFAQENIQMSRIKPRQVQDPTETSDGRACYTAKMAPQRRRPTFCFFVIRNNYPKLACSLPENQLGQKHSATSSRLLNSTALDFSGQVSNKSNSDGSPHFIQSRVFKAKLAARGSRLELRDIRQLKRPTVFPSNRQS